MQHSTRFKRVSARLVLASVLATLGLIQDTHAYHCHGSDTDYSGSYAGLANSYTACSPGTYNPGCGYGCSDAPAGTYVSGSGQSSYSSCSSGYYSGGGATSCSPVPSGFQLTQTSSTPTPCPEGFYSSGQKCYVCVAGYICNSATSTSTVYAPYYALGQTGYQSRTEPGYAHNGASLPPVPCAGSGYYWNSASGYCLICPAGYACPSSQTTSAQICFEGWYSSQEGNTECTACPAGSECPVTGSNLYYYAQDCAYGTYSLGYQSSCTPCPEGYYCPSPSSYPVLCPAGTTSTGSATRCTVNTGGYMSVNIATGQVAVSSTCTLGQYYVYNATDPITRCNDCPKGHYCDDVNSMPKPCQSGYYSDVEGNHVCTICPAGSACQYPNHSPVVCPNNDATNGVHGYTSVAGQTGCTADHGTCLAGEYKYPNPSAVAETCPEGYACPYCWAKPTLCPRGYYTTSGETACNICEAGYKCPTSYASMKEACGTGYYSAEGSINCYPVGQHMTTTATSIRPTWCAYTTYSALTVNDCVTCPENYWCPGDNVAPIICPNSVDNNVIAYTSFAGENSCFAKTASRGGTNSMYTSAEFDNRVSEGFYSQTGGTKNYDCPRGRECLFPMENIFIQCPPGTYDVTGKFHCQPCPEGKVCPIMQEGYIDNTGGTVQNRFFSPYGTHVELMIPAGWYTDASNDYMIRPCALGYYSADGATGGCTICPIGYQCPFGSNEPIRCNEGGEALSEGMHECTPCTDDQWFNPTTYECEIKPDNYFAIHPIFAVQDCKYNEQSSTSTFSNNNFVDCEPVDGTYYIKSTNTYSQTCPDGFWCKHTAYATSYTKIPCLPGWYGSGSTGQADVRQACLICPAGSYCTGGAEAPTDCPKGYICPEGTEFATQFPCPLCTMRQSVGGTSYSDCESCPGGMMCLEGTDQPFDCPPGEDCSTCPWTAGPCPSGEYASGGICYSCPAGEYCKTGSSYGLKCPSGTIAPNTGGKSVSDCQLVPANSPSSKYGQTAVPTDYTTYLGYVYPEGTAFSHQIPCPAGQVCDGTAARAWEDCPVGYACNGGHDTTSALVCEPGYDCPAGTMHTRQFPMTDGNYDAEGTDTECPAGYYCPHGTTVPRPCPLGYWCEAGILDYKSYPCPPGTYGATIRLTAEDECSSCKAGYYCQPGFTQPQLCPAGTYSLITTKADSAHTTSGLGLSTPCVPCTAGYFCPYPGTAAPLECGNGYFSPEGSTECFTCYAGHLCDTTTTTQAYMEANTCDGVECLTWAIYEVNTCPSGYYCAGAQFKPLPCPVGTYQDDGISQDSISTCQPVPAGYYNDEQAQNLTQTQVKLCSPGYTCPAGSISKFAVPCPPGEYQSTGGMTTCDTCPEGYYCLGATQYPIPCPAGYYCEDGVFEPTQCPIGTFGANTKLTELSECTTCTKGSFCAEPGANHPTGLCNAGFYCEAGSIIPEENDCPAGSYCEQGSFEGTNCPAGYYNTYTNMKSFQECVLCTPGQYCDGSDPSTPTGLCSAGWYCESGSRVIDQFAARPGYYTLEGATQEVECPAQTYNPYYYQDSCTTCPAGFYCDSTAMTEPIICPIGKYCELGSETPVQCPIGTYNPVLGGTSIATHCLDCPPGRYCANKGLSAPTGDCDAGYFCFQAAETNRPSALDLVSGRWGKCTIGHYCPIATAYPYPCPAGTFSASESLTAASECTDCTAGSYCETTGLTQVTGPCDEGFYCPTGSKQPRTYATRCTEGNYCPEGSATETACPGGSYQHQEFQGSCITCPAGYYCADGSTDPVICPVGAFCMESSDAPTYCGIGKYMPDTGASTDCISCPPGYYCPTTGLSAATLLCDAGYVCTQLSYTATPTSTAQGGFKCQQGFYCPEGSGFALQCPPGKACPNTGMTDTDMTADTTYDCAAGYYCLLGAITTTPLSEGSQGGDYCTTGHYCPQGTSVPIPCEPGTYRGSRGGVAATDCAPCPAGNFCEHYGSTTYEVCDEGWYCDTGATYGEVSGTPWDDVNSVPKVCPVGYYCTAGLKYACSGKYQDEIGQNSCKACPAGYQCTTEALIECGQSNNCPSGDMTPTKCTDGYYTLKTTASSHTECLICPAGYYCTCTLHADGYCTGDATITLCPEGYFCPEATYDYTVRECSEGYYCPAGTYYEIPCPPGYMCDGTGNTFTSKLDCPAGYYCSGGSTSATKVGCTAGNYCEINSHALYPCELGTYNPDTLSTSSDACLTCPAGSTCSTRGQAQDDAAAFTCEAGYYCPDDGPKTECPKGYYCPTDSTTPTPCDAGSYTDNLAQASCVKCPKGYYCGDDVLDAFDSTATKIIADEAIPCVAGQYCPKGSYLLTSTGLPGQSCPIGTFNPDLGARQIGDCIDCPEGYSCTTTGVSDDYDALTQCAAGFYCPGASISKSAIECPTGAYCPAGSVYFIQCSVGTYQDEKGKSDPTDCESCDTDYYCSAKGITSSSMQLCGDGFICLGGTAISTPMSLQNGDFCPEGHYCSRLQQGAQECAIGTYQPNTGQSACLNCPAGQLCDSTGMTVPGECPIGHYCPARTSSVTNEAIECPAGTYGDRVNLGSVEECVPCEPGKFCTAGQTSRGASTDCDETFFCPIGSSAGNGYSNDYEFGVNVAGLCPAGYTCPAGTTAPVPCPVGTYQPLSGQTDCDDCLGGYYCDELGMSELNVDQYCAAGYYCTVGSEIPNPIGLDATWGDKCQPGYFCPAGSAEPTLCPAGTYEPREGSDECQECPIGYYCEIGCFKPVECEKGYCPAGSSAPTLCPDGTYGSESLKKLESLENCPFCPNGQYCNSGEIKGECDAGYFCDFGATAWRDEDKICPAGHYCPSGTDLPIRCPETLYFAGTGATNVGYCAPCQAGYYCLDNDSVSRVCPRGHFCPEKTKEPVSCWEGTYNPYKKQSSSQDCIPCPAGASCNSRGIDDYLRHMCPIGHYCPRVGSKQDPTPCPAGTYRNDTGAADVEECWQCPEGYFCVEGSPYFEPCDAGYFCPAGSSVQQACEPGTYCPAVSGAPQVCPKGYFCPTYRTDVYTKCGNGTYCEDGASAETRCPDGNFGTGTTFNYNQTSSCIPCGPGQYSDAQSKTCQPCEQGYICFEGARTSRPNGPADNGQICDPGMYCLKGAVSGVACPVGTYSNQKGNGQLNDCNPCPINTFGNSVGQTECQACKGSTVSDRGSTTCKCVGLNRKYLSDVGQCVCISNYEPTDGSDSLADGFSDCQKNVYERCKETEERDITGKCRPKDDCAAECNGGTGTLQQNFGICQCDDVVTTAQICNNDCQESSLVTTFTSEGKVQIYDPKTKNSTIVDMPNTIGSPKCSKEDQTQCQLVGVGMSSSSTGAFQGSYSLPSSLTKNETIAEINRENIKRQKKSQNKNKADFESKNTNNATLNGRSLQSTVSSNANAEFISDPVICTTKGSAIIWDSLSSETYPVYQKDSLLNTNQNFDYGSFTALPTLLANLTDQNFVFTFDEAGVYVFSDSRNPSKLMIVSVMSDDHKCPADSKFSPLTYASLLKVGAYQNDVLLPPDWAFFFITLISFIVLIVIAVLLVSFIARRDWKQRSIPAIIYQQNNYRSVDRDDPMDNRAIVSINTDSSSFMFRAQGHDDGKDMGEQLVDRMKGNKSKVVKKQNRKERSRKDLSLNQVEHLKDALHKHLKEIKKLRALRYGKDGAQVDDELGNDLSDYTSSDEDELNSTIANVKKLIENARAVLRGEGDEEIQIFTDDTKMIEAINTDADKRQEREEAIRLRKEQLEENTRVQEEKFKRKIVQENDKAIDELENMKNKVLEMQVESAYDRGKAFQERMHRGGAQDNELDDMMGQLENKMQRVEDLLLDDKDRQQDMLKRQLEQRRLRRRKLNDKLADVEEELHKNEYEQADVKNEVVKELQEELKVEMQALEEEDKIARENLAHKFEKVKSDKLADYQDKLRNAGGSKDFQNILDSYQNAQLQVEKELKRQVDKENDKLDRELKARKARVKAQAEIRRNQRFKELEAEQMAKVNDQIDGKAKIEEALSTNERKDEILHVFGDRLKDKINDGNKLVTEMERKRRDEESLKQDHERQQRKVQGEAMKEATVLNKDVDDEIDRLVNHNSFEPFQALVNERSNLQKQIQQANTDEERDLLLKQLQEVDSQVKNQLGAEAKDQDAALKRKLEARRLKRDKAIEKERKLKEALLQDRISYALDNSTQFAVYRNELTNEAFEKIVNQMKMELTPEEIPDALDSLIDDKHQKELSDWLLKLYEQKAIELKEEILTLMEEKIAKQSVLKKNCEDRKKGIDAILSRTDDPAARKELESRKDNLQNEMTRDVNKLETDFVAAETKKTREIQERSMDRETKALQEMSEMHFEEKKIIFEKYLPDSLMKDLFDELSAKEREDMDLYKKELEAVKAAKLAEMEENERRIQAELLEQQSQLQKLSAEEAAIAKKELMATKRKEKAEREKHAVVNSQDVIEKIREDMEKGLEGLSGAYEEEHKRQLAMMEARLANRSQQVQEALEAKKLEALRKAEQAELEKKRENDKVRECRKRKTQLLETITKNQKLILKGCYSRPLNWHFNKKLHDQSVKNDDMATLLQNQSSELKQQVMGRLLKKVTDLEEKINTDVHNPKKTHHHSGGLMSRLNSRAGRTGDDVSSNQGSDKVSNARSLLANLFKKK